MLIKRVWRVNTCHQHSKLPVLAARNVAWDSWTNRQAMQTGDLKSSSSFPFQSELPMCEKSFLFTNERQPNCWQHETDSTMTLLPVFDLTIAVITVEPADKISFVYNCMQTRLRGQYNGKWPISLACVSRPLVTVITAIDKYEIISTNFHLLNVQFKLKRFLPLNT